MAFAARQRRFPFGLSLVILVAVVLAGLLAVQWLTALVWSLIRLALIMVAFVAIFRIGLYLVRNGKPPTTDDD